MTWWGEPFYFYCPANYILTGVNSIHENSHEDRRWKFRCCRAENHFTRKCLVNGGYINDWNQMMDYNAGAYVFTGVYSYYSNERQ